MKLNQTILLIINLMGITLTTLADETPQVQIAPPTQEAITAQTTAPVLESPNWQVGEIQWFKGRLIKVEWQKTAESYCEGGGDYYVLVVKDHRYTLGSLRDPIYEQSSEAFYAIQSRLEKLVGRSIVIKGQEVVRYFSQQEHCPDPQMQCIAGDLTCSWLRVLKIVKK